MNEELNKSLHAGNCIRTYSGLYVNVFEPTLDMLCIEDIAHALSNMPRFGGHTRKFYSVAQHSVICATMAIPEYELDTLMHDAAEAYLLDMPKPIKRGLDVYNDLENKMMALIAQKFNLTYPFDSSIKKIDKAVLEMEFANLMTGTRTDLKPLSPEEAKKAFLDKYYQLTRVLRVVS